MEADNREKRRGRKSQLRGSSLTTMASGLCKKRGFIIGVRAWTLEIDVAIKSARKYDHELVSETQAPPARATRLGESLGNFHKKVGSFYRIWTCHAPWTCRLLRVAAVTSVCFTRRICGVSMPSTRQLESTPSTAATAAINERYVLCLYSVCGCITSQCHW